MADTRIKDLASTITTLDGTEYMVVDNLAGGTKKILTANAKAYILGAGIDIGGTGAGDIATIDGTQTFTNKTHTSPKLNENVAVTSLASDVNLLAGLAAAGLTGTELGYVNGVTSAIQTQLNALQPRYGEIYIAGGATAQTVAKATWTALTFSGAGGANGEDSSGITADKANSKITISTDGVYKITYQVTFQTSDDALTHQFSIYRDGSILGNSISGAYIPTKNLSHTISCSFIHKEGAQPKDYQLRYYHDHPSATADITISSANVLVQRLGD